MAFLHPESISLKTVDKYISELDGLAGALAEREIGLIAVKTPLPGRVLTKLSGRKSSIQKFEVF